MKMIVLQPRLKHIVFKKYYFNFHLMIGLPKENLNQSSRLYYCLNTFGDTRIHPGDKKSWFFFSFLLVLLFFSLNVFTRTIILRFHSCEILSLFFMTIIIQLYFLSLVVPFSFCCGKCMHKCAICFSVIFVVASKYVCIQNKIYQSSHKHMFFLEFIYNIKTNYH